MFARCFIVIGFIILVAGTAQLAPGQLPDSFPDASVRSRRQRPDEEPKRLREMLAKQQAERDKKEHQEMLERGEEVLLLSKQLEASYVQNGGLSPQDMVKLNSLERGVEKIRKGLGGDDDEDDTSAAENTPADEEKPSNVAEAIQYLKTTTVKLVDELKKTTRFSISAIAIQTSNNVLKLVRFLRIRK